MTPDEQFLTIDGRRWLAHLDVEHRGRPDMRDPRVPLQRTNAQNCRFEERFGLHLHRVPDATHVDERDGAGPQSHGLNRSIFAFCSPQSAPCENRGGDRNRAPRLQPGSCGAYQLAGAQGPRGSLTAKYLEAKRNRGKTSRDYAEQHTKPELRERLKEKIKKSDKGGRKTQWSAHRSQLLAAEYKKEGRLQGQEEGEPEGPGTLGWGELANEIRQGPCASRQDDGARTRVDASGVGVTFGSGANTLTLFNSVRISWTSTAGTIGTAEALAIGDSYTERARKDRGTSDGPTQFAF